MPANGRWDLIRRLKDIILTSFTVIIAKYNGEEMYFLPGTSCFNPTIVLPVEILMCYYLSFYLLPSFTFSSDVINSYKKRWGVSG